MLHKIYTIYIIYNKYAIFSRNRRINMKNRPKGLFETVKKVVIPSQCAHWRGNPPDKRNIFDSENIGFPKIWGIATPACGLVRDDRSFLTR